MFSVQMESLLHARHDAMSSLGPQEDGSTLPQGTSLKTTFLPGRGGQELLSLLRQSIRK